MLGRLHMKVDECIRAYRDLTREAFRPTPVRKIRRLLGTMFAPKTTTTVFSATSLENAVKLAIRKFCVEEECRSRRDQGQSTAETCPHENMLFRDGTCTKTYVNCNLRNFWKQAYIFQGGISNHQKKKKNVDAPPTLSGHMIHPLFMSCAPYGKLHAQHQRQSVSSNQ